MKVKKFSEENNSDLYFVYLPSFSRYNNNNQYHYEKVKKDVINLNINFIDIHENNLEESFNEKYNFQTSTRGLKVRGAFPSQQEAELRCKMLREIDPNHDVYVGPVGTWMPWDPDAYKTGRVEYLEDELNSLMAKKKKENVRSGVGIKDGLYTGMSETGDTQM